MGVGPAALSAIPVFYPLCTCDCLIKEAHPNRSVTNDKTHAATQPISDTGFIVACGYGHWAAVAAAAAAGIRSAGHGPLWQLWRAGGPSGRLTDYCERGTQGQQPPPREAVRSRKPDSAPGRSGACNAGAKRSSDQRTTFTSGHNHQI